jgi:hypothetical protein
MENISFYEFANKSKKNKKIQSNTTIKRIMIMMIIFKINAGTKSLDKSNFTSIPQTKQKQLSTLQTRRKFVST